MTKRRALTPWRFGLMAVLMLGLAGCEDPKERAAKHYVRAMSLIEQGDITRGRIELRNALKLDDQLSGARFELGRLNEEAGNLGNAVNNYRLTAEADKSHVEARLRLARLLVVGGAPEEARDRISEAYALAPDNIDVITTYAAVQTGVGQQEAGLDLARKALQIDPDNIEANTIIISQIAQSGDLPAALAEAEALIERLPPDLNLHMVKLQLLLRGTGEVNEVRAQLGRMVELFPEQLDLRRALAQVAIEQGDTEEALAQLRAVSAASPTDQDAQTDVVRFLMANDRRDEAEQELRAVIANTQRRRDAAPLQIFLAQMLLGRGDSDGARQILDTAIEEAAQARVARDMLSVALARLELGEGNTEAATRLVEVVLENDESNVDALALRASLLLDRDAAEDAVMDLRRALNLDPRNVPLLLLEAQAQLRLGNTALARDRLATAYRVSGRQPEIALRYAAFLNDRGEPDAAETALVESLENHPADRNLLIGLTRLRIERGDMIGAQELEERLRNLEDGEQLADRLRATLLAQQGQTDESVALLERLLVENRAEGPLAGLVVAYAQDGRLDDAISLLDTLIAEDRANVVAQLLRAELHFAAGEIPQADARLRDAVEAAPERPEPYQALVRLSLVTDRIDEAERVAREGIAAVERNGDLRFLLTGILEQEGRFDEAIAEYEILYDQNPNSMIIANNLASLLAEFRAENPEALERASRVSRRLRDSNVPHFKDTYGWIAFLSGDVSGAIPYLEAAAEGLPNNALVFYHLGRAYASAGQTEAARTNLEAALAIDPSFAKAQSAREALSGLRGGG